MKKILKFTGIGLAVITVILFLGYDHGKFIKRITYKDCPSYIFVVAEITETKPDLSILQEKINNLKLGNVTLKSQGENEVLILVQSDNNLMEEEHQMLVALLKELGLQENKMEGGGAYRAKTCNNVGGLIERSP